MHRGHLVFEVISKRRRRALVKEYAHSCHLQRSRRVLQHDTRLLRGDTREPAHEVIDIRAVFEVLEERFHRYAGTTKYPRAADTLWITFNG